MKLTDFGLLTDQNVHPRVVTFLRAAGFDVLDVREQGWRGLDDVSLLNIAVAGNRLVVTHDADFGDLAVRSGQPAIGILYVRPGHISADYTMGTLQSLFDVQPNVTPPFLLIAKRHGQNVSIRVRDLAS